MVSPAKGKREFDQLLEVLKYLAIFAMALDHVDHVWLERTSDFLFSIGRISFPIFVVLVSFRLFESVKRVAGYQKKLLAWMVLAEPISWLVFGQLSILASLLVGVLLIRFYSEANKTKTWWEKGFYIFVFLVILSSAVSLSSVFQYGVFGPIAILILFFLFNVFIPHCKNYNEQVLTLSAALVLALFIVQAFIGNPVNSAPLLFVIALSAWQLSLSVPRVHAQVYYGFYPVHLLVLYLSR